MIVQQILSYRRVFSKASPKYHQNSLSKFSELADRFLRETFEMFFQRSHYHSDNYIYRWCTLFFGGRKIFVNFTYSLIKYTNLLLNVENQKLSLLSQKLSFKNLSKMSSRYESFKNTGYFWGPIIFNSWTSCSCYNFRD